MSSNTQIIINQFGDAELLAFQQSEQPQPQAGEVLVKVAFAAVNPIDVKTRAGLGWAAQHNKNNLPWVPGYDVSGSIVKQGAGCLKFNLNDNVSGFIGFPLRAGGYSQYVCVPESELALMPEDISLESAAAIPLAGQTAAQALEKAKIQPKEKILILAGAGGVGHIATQIAVAAKTQVYATCGTDNIDYVTALGATAIDYTQPDWQKNLNDVDVLIDLVGGEQAIDALCCLRPGSRVVTVPTITSSFVCEKANELGLIGMGMLVEPDITQLEELLHLISAGMIKIKIEKIFPYQDVVQAHHKVEQGHARGKILLNMQA
ncbi:NADP-dependent oxidoreductase [Vibrio sp. S11_S32]|uniref:NADP-dependent oxidoreductase n=1 Tax=Vibrio sp. S11_S32 TaxID=2720225 RepID=UPI001680E068|nr:NADP-dependent oxidoreductase [Vibrio sp. S11_S32]MBD1576074.1 NADP-dependent oxidoreductase [Vibrio sp. S11_S32]